MKKIATTLFSFALSATIACASDSYYDRNQPLIVHFKIADKISEKNYKNIAQDITQDIKNFPPDMEKC